MAVGTMGRLSDEEIRTLCGQHLDLVDHSKSTKKGDTLIRRVMREMDARLTPQILQRMDDKRVDDFLGIRPVRFQSSSR